MTIFPCCRCGVTPPDPKPGAPDPQGWPSMVLRHHCRADDRDYKVTFWGRDQDANADDCIYRWNEVNARDDPAWHAERYDYLRARCQNRRGGVPQ
jgi:hypothetical protein